MPVDFVLGLRWPKSDPVGGLWIVATKTGPRSTHRELKGAYGHIGTIKGQSMMTIVAAR